jgi:hypothetical protein
VHRVLPRSQGKRNRAELLGELQFPPDPSGFLYSSREKRVSLLSILSSIDTSEM